MIYAKFRTRGLLLLLFLILSSMLFSSERFNMPFDITGSVTPDKPFYEKGETVNFNITITLDKKSKHYIEGKQYHIKSSGYVGNDFGNRIITSSNIDSVFTMDDKNCVVNLTATASVTHKYHLMVISFGFYRIGFNDGVQLLIDKGTVPENDSEVQWNLQHDMYRTNGISNTKSKYQGNINNYWDTDIYTNSRDNDYNLMTNSEFRFPNPNGFVFTLISVIL